VQFAEPGRDRAEYGGAVGSRPVVGDVPAAKLRGQHPAVASVNDSRAEESGRGEPLQPVCLVAEDFTLLVVEELTAAREADHGCFGEPAVDWFGVVSAEPTHQFLEIHSAKATVQRQDQLPI
jgi:hypothetical protein